MNAIVQARLGDVAVLCRRYPVRRLAPFGSATRPEFDPPRSDLDFLVDLERLSPRAHADACFGLPAAT
jgi:predicted nucleotidyltransferase